MNKMRITISLAFVFKENTVFRVCSRKSRAPSLSFSIMAIQQQQRIFGLELKYVALLVLVVQNSSLILTGRYSRTVPGPQ